MALIDIAPGQVGAVVTYLEMRQPPEPRPLPAAPLSIRHWPEATPLEYRTLFERVGGQWLWFSRLRMDDETLGEAIGALHVVTDGDGAQAGMVELDFGTPGECLIRFLGLVPQLAGKGYGRWLFAQTLALAWRDGVERVHVNTCSLDHPAALPSYLKAGFRAYKRAFESFPDPRLLGLLPRGTAPQVPIVAA